MRGGEKWWRRHAVARLIVLLGILGVLVLLIGILGAVLAESSTADELWLELAKAGIQIVAVGVVGGALAQAWRRIQTQREAAAAADDKIRAELAELVALYNNVKAVRRRLRSLGLDTKLYVPDDPADRERCPACPRKGRRCAACTERLAAITQRKEEQRRRAGRTVRLTEEQARGFHAEMWTLNTIQLAYEAKVRQFKQANLLAKADRKSVKAKLKAIESYLNGVVDDPWEEHGWTIRAGTRLEDVSDPLQKLYRKAEFRPRLSRPMREITRIMNRHLFGAPSTTQDARPTDGST